MPEQRDACPLEKATEKFLGAVDEIADLRRRMEGLVTCRNDYEEEIIQLMKRDGLSFVGLNTSPGARYRVELQFSESKGHFIRVSMPCS